MAATFGISEEDIKTRLDLFDRLVAKPIPEVDSQPGRVGQGLYVGTKNHAVDADQLASLGITAVLNCAPSGISKLPLEAYRKHGISYRFTNCREDDDSYPLLHSRHGVRSAHLQTARNVYEEVRDQGGNALFFCVAGQNRSATLAVAVLLLQQEPLEKILAACAESRPFVLENKGFQRQLVELEALVCRAAGQAASKGKRCLAGLDLPDASPKNNKRAALASSESLGEHVEVELVVPGLAGLCTFDVEIPAKAAIPSVKQILVERVNRHLASTSCKSIGTAWLVFSMFGFDPEYDLCLEVEAVESSLQVARLEKAFGLEVVQEATLNSDAILRWTDCCRFELFIFSLVKSCPEIQDEVQEPFTFVHKERSGAPGTFLIHYGATYLRAWDFGTGVAFRSTHAIVFSFSEDPRNKRDFMNVSTSENKRQQFNAPGEGGILGMGNNAIVHHVQLDAVSKSEQTLILDRPHSDVSGEKFWDAAVKRPFSLGKMLASLEHKSEAGVAKRLRMAGALNKNGRLLYFYGLGIALASNNNNHDEYKFEACLLSHYQEEFSSYTLKRFMNDYTAVLDPGNPDAEIAKLQKDFTLIKVKVLLVSLLNGFRDLTLMGVQAFDFNHLNNVLISRDYRKARLIDIDGASKGSIQFPSEYIEGPSNGNTMDLHKPALDIDLSTLLPVVVQQLIFGKGRGKQFVNDSVGKVRRASSKSDEAAKEIIKTVICENFFPHLQAQSEGAPPPSPSPTQKHLLKVVEWFYAMLMKRSPWTTWTDDVYDAMRCIDHLPIG
eukprot:TRINITY_DN32985_c0_g1_i1.p1 TRINITY_DN32985_c0_g1~~TRINITY_DN32985_c0_g1_i1.p1  ORF type:complete len:779 (-),score=133.68 TRINITY_DN32985_c0_g1_i1:288-2624(-)